MSNVNTVAVDQARFHSVDRIIMECNQCYHLGHAEIVDTLIRNGANGINATNTDGDSMLHVAASNGNEKV